MFLGRKFLNYFRRINDFPTLHSPKLSNFQSDDDIAERNPSTASWEDIKKQEEEKSKENDNCFYNAFAFFCCFCCVLFEKKK